MAESITASDLVSHPAWATASEENRRAAIDELKRQQFMNVKVGESAHKFRERMKLLGDEVDAITASGRANPIGEATIRDLSAGRDPNERGSDTEFLLSKREAGFWENVDRSFNRAVGGLAEQAASMPSILTISGLKEFEDNARQYAQAQRVSNQPLLTQSQIVDLEDWTIGDMANSAWWSSTAAESIFSSIPVLAAGVAAAPVVGALGGGALLTAGATGVVGGLGGLQVAAETYNNLRSQGYSREEAGDAARKVAVPAIGSGVLGGAAAGSVMRWAGARLTPAMSKAIKNIYVRGATGVAAGVAGGGTIEGSQELYETAVQKAGEEWARAGRLGEEQGFWGDSFVAIGDANPLPAIFGWEGASAEDRQTFFLGAIIGIAADAPAAVASNIAELKTQYDAGEISDPEMLKELTATRKKLKGLRGEQLRQVATEQGTVTPASETDPELRKEILQKQKKQLQEVKALQEAEAVPATFEESDPRAKTLKNLVNDSTKDFTDEEKAAVAFQPVEAPTEALGKVAGLIEKITGKKVGFFRQTIGGKETSAKFRGFVDDDGILIDAGMSATGEGRTLSEVLGHEVVHSIRSKSEKAYQELVKVATQDADAMNRWLNVENKKRALVDEEALTIDDLKAQEEFVGDFVGQFALDPAFLKNVAEKSPVAFDEVAEEGRGFLSKALDALKGKADPVIAEQVTEARAAIEEILSAEDFASMPDTTPPPKPKAESKLTVTPIKKKAEPKTEEAKKPTVKERQAKKKPAVTSPTPPIEDVKNALRKAGAKVSRFHGTAKELDGLQNYTYSTFNFYGQGLYTTDSIDAAMGYMKIGKGKSPTLYAIKEKRDDIRLYDADAPMQAEVKDAVERVVGTAYEGITQDSEIESLVDVFREIRQSSQSEGISADEVQDIFLGIRENLETMGFDGLSHADSFRSQKGKTHKVNLYFNPESDLEIEKIDPSSEAKSIPLKERQKRAKAKRAESPETAPIAEPKKAKPAEKKDSLVEFLDAARLKQAENKGATPLRQQLTRAKKAGYITEQKKKDLLEVIKGNTVEEAWEDFIAELEYNAKPKGKTAPEPQPAAEAPATSSINTSEEFASNKKADEAFNDLAEAQRGAPESRMLRATMAMARYFGGNTWSELLEHIGDLTHRMAQRPSFYRGSYENVKQKVTSKLDYDLEADWTDGNPQLVEEQFKQWLDRGDQYNKSEGRTGEEHNRNAFIQNLSKHLSEYVSEHRALTVYNEAQAKARDAAVAVGEARFVDAARILNDLRQTLDKDQQAWENAALEADLDAQGNPIPYTGTDTPTQQPIDVTSYAAPEASPAPSTVTSPSISDEQAKDIRPRLEALGKKFVVADAKALVEELNIPAVSEAMQAFSELKKGKERKDAKKRLLAVIASELPVEVEPEQERAEPKEMSDEDFEAMIAAMQKENDGVGDLTEEEQEFVRFFREESGQASYTNFSQNIFYEANKRFAAGSRSRSRALGVANPFLTKEGREFHRQWQEAALKEGAPDARPNAEVEKKLQDLIDKDYKGSDEELTKAMEARKNVTDDLAVRTLAFRRAIKWLENNGSFKDKKHFHRLSWISTLYADYGKELSDAFRLRREDLYMTPEEKASHNLSRLLGAPSEQLVRDLQRALRDGASEEKVAAIKKKIEKKNEETLEALAFDGVDVDALKERVKKEGITDETIQEILFAKRVIESVNWSMNPLYRRNGIHEFFMGALLGSLKTINTNALGSLYGVYKLGMEKAISHAMHELGAGASLSSVYSDMKAVTRHVLGSRGTWETMRIYGLMSFRMGTGAYQAKMLGTRTTRASVFERGFSTSSGSNLRGAGRALAKQVGRATGSDKARKGVKKVTDGMVKTAMLGPDGIIAVDEMLRIIFSRTAMAWSALSDARAMGLSDELASVYIHDTLENPMSETAKKGMDLANQALFQSMEENDQTLIARWIMQAKDLDYRDLRGEKGVMLGTAGAVARLTFPFVNTPANLIRIGLMDLTPVSLYGAGKGVATLVAGAESDSAWTYNNTHEATEAIVQGVATSLAWGAIVGLLMSLEDEDEPWIEFTGGAKLDPFSGEARFARDGRKPMSFKVRGSDEWHSYARIDPFATAFALAVDAYDTYRRVGAGQDSRDAMIRFGDRVAGQVNEKAFLRQVADLNRVVRAGFRDDEKYLKNYVTNIGVSFVPATIRQLSMESDDFTREHSTYLETEQSRIRQRTARYTEEPAMVKLDWLGREKQKGELGDLWSPLPARMLAPVYSTTVPDHEINRMISSWNEAHIGTGEIEKGKQYYPTFPLKSMKIDGEQVQLTEGEFSDLLKDRGELIEKRWSFLRRSISNIDEPTEKEMLKLKSAVDKAHRKAYDKIKKRVEKRIASQ